jgi:hypothetical protein
MAGEQRIVVRDISITGVGIAHREPLGPVGKQVRVAMEWDGHRIYLTCEVRWSLTQRSTAQSAHTKTLWHSGLRIVSPETPESAQLLIRDLVAHHVERALDEQRANARGIPAKAAHSFQTGASTVFRTHIFGGGAWKSTETTERRQPISGFTVAGDHPLEEVEMLRNAYEAADGPGRQMIRRLAEMSIASEDGIPTRRYEP